MGTAGHPGLNPTVLLIGAGAVAVAVLLASRQAAAELGERAGGAAVDLVDGVIGGAVVGIGENIGVPATSETECERAIREGRTWDASFACPAKRFLEYLAGR